LKEITYKVLNIIIEENSKLRSVFLKKSIFLSVTPRVPKWRRIENAVE